MVCIYHTATWMSLSVSCALYGNFLYVEFRMPFDNALGACQPWPILRPARRALPARAMALSDTFISFSMISTV